VGIANARAPVTLVRSVCPACQGDDRPAREPYGADPPGAPDGAMSGDAGDAGDAGDVGDGDDPTGQIVTRGGVLDVAPSVTS